MSLRGSSSRSSIAMVLRSASSPKAIVAPPPPPSAEKRECSNCGHGPVKGPPPPTESFYFCMNTPWWSPGGPGPAWYGGGDGGLEGDAVQGEGVQIVQGQAQVYTGMRREGGDVQGGMGMQ